MLEDFSRIVSGSMWVVAGCVVVSFCPDVAVVTHRLRKHKTSGEDSIPTITDSGSYVRIRLRPGDEISFPIGASFAVCVVGVGAWRWRNDPRYLTIECGLAGAHSSLTCRPRASVCTSRARRQQLVRLDALMCTSACTRSWRFSTCDDQVQSP